MSMNDKARIDSSCSEAPPANTRNLKTANARRRHDQRRVASRKLAIGLNNPGRPIELVAKVVATSYAKKNLAGMILAAAKDGCIYLIEDAKVSGAASALLVCPTVLQARLSQVRTTRTLGQVLETLPFRRPGTPRITVELPDDVAPELTIRAKDVG